MANSIKRICASGSFVRMKNNNCGQGKGGRGGGGFHELPVNIFGLKFLPLHQLRNGFCRTVPR